MDDIVDENRPRARDFPASAGYALTVEELLALPSLSGSTLVAGQRGLEKIVRRVNVIEVPDILPWVKLADMVIRDGRSMRMHSSSWSKDWPNAVPQRSASRKAATSGKSPRP